jgi:hypothetical protein
MKYQVITSAGDGDDLRATCVTYEDALQEVVNIARRNDGFLRPTWHADAWDMARPDGTKKFLVVIQGVSG